VAVAVLLVVGLVVVLSPRARRAAREARAAELAAQRERSRADHPTSRAVRPAVTGRGRAASRAAQDRAAEARGTEAREVVR
jgi:UDP-GlcNAc:undecaprenyl-phosphate GlcNAc-1-phosphate transferase